MLTTAELFIRLLKSKGLQFESRELKDSEVLVAFPYDGKQTNFIFSGENGKYVTIVTKYEAVPPEKVPDVLVVANKLNSNYKWLKFYVDNDKDLMAQDDAILSAESAADECFELLIRQASILKDCRAEIMRAIYA